MFVFDPREQMETFHVHKQSGFKWKAVNHARLAANDVTSQSNHQLELAQKDRVTQVPATIGRLPRFGHRLQGLERCLLFRSR